MSATDKPLAGRRILVTRAPDRAEGLVRELQQAGAEVLLLPTVGTEPPPDWRPLDDALRHLEEFNAVLFVSTSAVNSTFKRAQILRKQEVMCNWPGRLVAAVGPATARAAAVRRIRVDYVASEHTGESLVRELGSSLRGRKVLLPRSDRGDKKLSESLREAGAEVTDVVAYRTAAPEPLDPKLISRIRSGEVHVLTFASPSAYDNLCNWIDCAELAKLSAIVQFATIGPITAGVIRKRGGRVSIVAGEPSARGFTEAIVKYYEREQSDREGAQKER